MAKAQNKTVATSADVQKFLNGVKHEGKREDAKRICEMMQEVTGEAPTMWGPGIIGFGHYHYKYDSGREGDFLRTGLSPRAKNLTVYIIPGFEPFGEILSRLGKHKTSSSCLYINKLADVDEDVLRELVQAGWDLMAERYPD